MLVARLVAHELFQRVTERWVAHSARIELKCRCVKPILCQKQKLFIINKKSDKKPVSLPICRLEKADEFFGEPKNSLSNQEKLRGCRGRWISLCSMFRVLGVIDGTSVLIETIPQVR